MDIHLCDICKLKIPDREKYVTVAYKTYSLGGFSICKRCGEPILDFLNKHGLVAEE